MHETPTCVYIHVQARAERSQLTQQLIQVSTQAAQASGMAQNEQAKIGAVARELLATIEKLQRALDTNRYVCVYLFWKVWKIKQKKTVPLCVKLKC